MKTILTWISCAMLGVGALGIVAAPAAAQPGALAKPAQLAAAGAVHVEHVQYRSYGRGYGGYRNYGYRRNDGRNIALGIGAAIIGGIALSEAARAEHRTTYAGDWDRCAETYRSFESSTGMYTGYDGVRRTCPYLN